MTAGGSPSRRRHFVAATILAALVAGAAPTATAQARGDAGRRPPPGGERAATATSRVARIDGGRLDQAVRPPGPADLAAGAARRTLERLHDPVVVTGRDLAALPVRDTARLRLVRFEGGHARPLRFQFDQRDARGDVVVPGPVAFDLDGNDELVFMARDAGDRADGDPCASAGDCDAALEIEIADREAGTSAWVYLVANRTLPPAPVFDPYVSFDADNRVATSDNYRVEYADARNYFTGIHVGRAATGDAVEVVRRSHMRGTPTFSVLLSQLTLDFSEQTSIVELDGVRSGPVRAVRRVRLSVEMGALFPDLPNGTAYTFHYATSYFTPSKVSFPWLMVKTLRDFRFESVLDLAVPSPGDAGRYFDAANPDGISLAADGPEIRGAEDHEWWVHSGRNGSMLHAFEIPNRWREWGIVRGSIVRATDQAAPPSGGRAAGYTLLHMTKLREAGTFDLMMMSVVLPRPYQGGDEIGPLAMIHAPLSTEVRRIR